MSNINLKDRYTNYAMLQRFFESPDEFSSLCHESGISFHMDSQLYSHLFYGTDMNIYVPLWASVAKTGEDVLLNHITLDVIRFYKAYGYSPVFIDGNPADFVGEQLRFLEHLSAWALNGSMEADEAIEAMNSFEDNFLIDTLALIKASIIKALGIEEQADMEVPSMDQSISFVISLMDQLASRSYFQWHLAPESFTSYSTKKNPPIEVEPIHQVSIASNCDCGSKCKMLATVSEGCILAIEPDRYGTDIPFVGCPRGRAYAHTYLTSKRLRYPMIRIGQRGEGKFKRITWQEATQRVAKITKEAGKVYGPGSRFVINAAGVSAALRGDRFMKNLLACDGGYLDYYNYYSAACAAYITPYLYGKVQAGNHEATYADSRLIIFWGYNPMSCHYGVQTKDYFMKAKEKGAKLIAIDPRMSDTVMTLADEWIPIRPSSDTALIDAMAHVIWSKGLQDQEFMDKFCIGFDEDHMPEGVPSGQSYHSHVFGLRDGIEKTPSWAEAITGIPAETIERLAVLYATTKPAALLPGYGPQRTMVGEQVCRGFIALACMTGNVGVRGGSNGVHYMKEGHQAPSMSHYPNPYPGAIPVFHWTRAIDKPETIDPVKRGLRGVDKLSSPIKVIYSLASGIVINQHSNINDTKRILKEEGKLDALILSDLFMTPSAQYADILLPAVSFFEMDNIPAPWADDDYLLYNHGVTRPLFGGRFEYEWIREVAKIMNIDKEFDQGKASLDEWLAHIYESCQESEPELPDLETFKKEGFYIFKEHKPQVNFQENIIGGKPFDTPSGKIEIFSKRLYGLNRPDEIPGTPGHIFCAEGPEDNLRSKYPLQLIAYHTKKRCHTQHDENPLLAELDPTALWINPADAEARGIGDGDLIEVFNDRGKMRIPAKVTSRIACGTIAVSEGGWYRPAKDGADLGGSINILTATDKATPIANGNPQHTNLADVRKA